MKPINFEEIILAEILAEGLEGITLESLWKHLAIFDGFKNINENFKNFIWKKIIEFEYINFYKLQEARECNFEIKNRMDFFDMEKNCFVEPIEPYEQFYHQNFLKSSHTYGSCESFQSRILIDQEIKLKHLTYTDVHEKYGNKLVIVGKEECRRVFLGVGYSVEYISAEEYSILELIGRHRYNGILSLGKHSILSFASNAQTVWSIQQRLLKKSLIKMQKIFIKGALGTINDFQLYHINQFYRTYYNVFEHTLEILFDYLKNIPCNAITINTCKEILNLSKEFLDRAIKLKWIEVILTTYRKLNETCHLPQIISDCDLLSTFINENSFDRNISETESLLDKRFSFIKVTKTLDNLKLELKDLDKIHKIKHKFKLEVKIDSKMNIDDPLDIQILNILATTPLCEADIRRFFHLKKVEVRRVLKDMIKNKYLNVTYKSKQKHSEAYYSIRSLSEKINSGHVTHEIEVAVNNRHCITKTVDPMIRNPRRQKRYEFVINLLNTNFIMPSKFAIKRSIQDWEKSLKSIVVMDSKSLTRILNDALNKNEIEIMEVKIKVNENIEPETWYVKPGVTEESEVFQEHYRRRLEFYENKIKNTSLVSIKSKKKKKKKKKKVPFSADQNVFSIVKNQNYDDKDLSDFEFPELPLMLRRKLLHEFIWYIAVGYSFESDFNFDKGVDENGDIIYVNHFNWKRYVAPLQNETNQKFISFDVNDLISRMPLCLLCLIAFPGECNQELYNYLTDKHLKWLTVSNLMKTNIPLISYVMNHKKKRILWKLIELIESLMNMGLINKKDISIRLREHGQFYFNMEVFLTDTSKYHLPIADKDTWLNMPRYQWILRTKVDLLNYWENVYNVCTSTKAKFTFIMHNLRILSNDSLERNRNSEYISEHIVENGSVLHEHVENIKQFGVWLPLDKTQWKDIGPGGYYRSISSSSIICWCQNRFDKSCEALPANIRDGFSQFRKTLFNDVERDSNTGKHISSLNENLSSILNEINIILIAAEVLHYDDLSFLFHKIRKSNWFKSIFTHISQMNFNTIEGYISIITTDHVNEKKYLTDLISNNELVQSYLRNEEVKSMRQNDWVKEAAFIRMLLTQLIKIYRFIPQWDSLSNNSHSITELINQISSSNIRQRMKVDGDEKIITNVEPRKKIIKEDKVDTLDEIIVITLSKYFTGCMYPYEEYKKCNIEIRNQILRQYNQPLILAAVNGFQQYYLLDPLKAKNIDTETLITTCINARIRRLTPKFTNLNAYQSNIDVSTGKYQTWAKLFQIDNNSTTVKFNFQNSEFKDVLFAISFLFISAQKKNQEDKMYSNLKRENCTFNDKKYNSKSICNSTIYTLNLRDKNMSVVNFSKMTAGSSLTMTYSKSTHKSLLDSPEHTNVWKDLTHIVLLSKSEENEPEKKKIKQLTELSFIEKVLAFIKDGEFAGRSYSELKNKFIETQLLLDNLQTLIQKEEIFVAGVNIFHFVSKNFIRPWLIKVSTTNNQTNKVGRKRKMSTSATTTLLESYFIPEFYKDESGQFKCVMFKEIIEKLYSLAYKTPGMTLYSLTVELSYLIGVNAVKQMIDVLVKCNVIELRQVSVTGKCGLFKKRVVYNAMETDPYDDGHNTTVIVSPYSHLNMSNLIKSMCDHFCVEFKESVIMDNEL